MKRRPGITAALLAVVLAGCGSTTVKTVTERETVPQAAATVERAAAKPVSKSKATTKPSGKWVACDPNIDGLTPRTSCAFAQNAFYEYWAADERTTLRVYSPALGQSLSTRCTNIGFQILCRAGDGGRARFSTDALASYSARQAGTYASTHDTGTDSTSAATAREAASSYTDPEDASGGPYDDPDLSDTAPGDEIPNYDNGTGYRVQCADGTYSQSGGRQGACSGHGGVG